LRDKYEVYEEAGLQPLTDEQTIEAAIFPGLKVDLGELFAEPAV
jgi:hypothetical protein